MPQTIQAGSTALNVSSPVEDAINLHVQARKETLDNLLDVCDSLHVLSAKLEELDYVMKKKIMETEFLQKNRVRGE